MALKDLPKIFSSKQPDKSLVQKLIDKWDLQCTYIGGKSMIFFISSDKSKDPINFSIEDKLKNDFSIYSEMPPKYFIHLLPESLLDFLLKSNFVLKYCNGASGNSYDAHKNIATIKKTPDVLHEIGHGLWYNLISIGEEEKKTNVINSLAQDNTFRRKLDDSQIPKLHKKYAFLVGAYSGQFLEKDSSNNRLNDLEEHFARNFDYLMKGKPLQVLPNSQATLTEFLDFYFLNNVVNINFETFYKASIQRNYNGKGIKQVSIDKIVDGDYLDSEAFCAILKLKKELGLFKE